MLLFLSLLAFNSTLYSHELSYGILDDCTHIDKRLRSFTFLYLQEKMLENFPTNFPHENGFLYGEIPVKEKNIIVARNSSHDDDEIYVYDSFNDSIHYIQADGITNIINPVLVKLSIPTLQQGVNSQPSIIKLFGLSSDKMLFGCADFRYGLLKIDDKEYFMGLVNNYFDYSNFEKTILYIDINNDGYISDMDSLDAYGNSTKEVLHANDSFIIDQQAYKIDSISVNGYNAEISQVGSEYKFSSGYRMPAFQYYDPQTGLFDTYKNNGDVTLIFYWSLGCGAAQMLIPIMNKLYENYKYVDGFRFISLVPELVDRVDKKVKELDVQFPFYDDNSKLEDIFGISVPKTVIIDSDGIIKTTFEGYFLYKSDKEDIENNEIYKMTDKYLKALLEKKKIKQENF